MVRAPCCEKMGLKKGPWTKEEDHILTSYIQRYGHGNWRALPKLAGLLRCGKSCRLRWINYLRPDIKRGNFTPEEEDMIISLHKVLGNRWSAIAARLAPGRTDNEIKNVWHTHLKKRANSAASMKQEFAQNNTAVETVSSSSHSSLSNNSSKDHEYTESSSVDEAIDDSFWTETLMMNEGFRNVSEDDWRLNATNELSGEEDIDYWFKFIAEAGQFLDLPEL